MFMRGEVRERSLDGEAAGAAFGRALLALDPWLEIGGHALHPGGADKAPPGGRQAERPKGVAGGIAVLLWDPD
eukprot:NODE_13828_length_239_cov_1.157609.p2 GENE.NODE_13828_length_239_cov_1.157609~~NODE_13828_length_239_cov_1.157609.p2  ORF type:complete len:73 (-),score=14.39 NODE_13828_length_239_cov_1.157609:21-239(-)